MVPKSKAGYTAAPKAEPKQKAAPALVPASPAPVPVPKANVAPAPAMPKSVAGSLEDARGKAKAKNAPAAASAPAAAQASPPADTSHLSESQKSELKKLQKRLKETQDLGRKLQEKQVLNDDQLMKLASKGSIEAMIDALMNGEPEAERASGSSDAMTLGLVEQAPPAGNQEAEVEDALKTVRTQFAVALDIETEKRFREYLRKLSDFAKLKKMDKLDKSQKEKLQRLEQEVETVLEGFLPLKLELTEIAARTDVNIEELQVERENRRVAFAEAARIAEEIARAPPIAPPRMGLDIGGCLTQKLNDVHTTENWESDATHVVFQAMQACQRIAFRFGPQNLHLLSMCGERMEKKTKTWLHQTMNIGQYGVRRGNIHFCRSRTGDDGKGKTAKALELSHFLDDNDDNLWSVYADPSGNSREAIDRHNGILFHFALNGNGRAPRPRLWTEDRASKVESVGNWAQVLQRLGA